MSQSEEQAEELEALGSIFEDDECYKQISETCIQYRIGEDGAAHSFLIEFVWPAEYPEVAPEINLNRFYNNRILPSVKEHIVKELNKQCEEMIGEVMTYTLIDWAKENLSELMADQPTAAKAALAENGDQEVSKKKEKKEQLSKAQKRKLFDRYGAGGERPRGWNWVDVIKHLSQTGKAHERSDS